MASLNHCQFIGNVGKIDTKYLPNGDAVTNLSLAVNESWKNKAGEKQEHTEWVRISTFGKLAEIAQKYLAVGNQVFMSGKMKTRKWTDKDGQDRYTTEIIGNEMVMLGSKSDGGERQERSPAAAKPEVQRDGFPADAGDLEEIPF